MKSTNCLKIILTVFFIMSPLSSAHAGQTGVVVSPSAGGAKVESNSSKVAPEKVEPGKVEPKAVPGGTSVVPKKKKIEIKEPQKPTLPVKCNGKVVTILGTSGDDVLNGTPGPDVIHGLGGDDIIRGMGGDDIICGGDGDDTLDGGEGNDILDGGPGRDECINGPSGKGFLVAPKNCEKQGVTVTEGTKKGAVEPKKGSGFVPESKTEKAISGGPTKMVPRDGSSGESGFVQKRDIVQVSLPKCNGQTPTIYGTSGDDILYGTQEADVIHGLGGNDKINGLGGDDIICGGDGNDEIEGAGGNDYLNGGKGDDHLWGSDGEDTLDGGGGNDKLDGGPGDDELKSHYSDSFLYGGDGNDVLRSLGGNNTIVGGPGNDNLYGGKNNDWLYGNAGDDYIRGGAGNDSLEGGPGNDVLYGDSGHDNIYGCEINDECDGSDKLYGGDGNDALYGGGGPLGGNGPHGKTTTSNELYGGAGNDRLYANLNSRLDGGPGNDVCFQTSEDNITNRGIAPINCEGNKPKTFVSKFKAETGGKHNSPKAFPYIDGTAGTPGLFYVSPDGKLYIRGGNFGTNKGHIYIYGTGFPDGKLELDPVVWESNSRVNGRVPLVTGIKDQKIEVEVVTNDGLVSNRHIHWFLGTRETRVLGPKDPAVRVDDCGTDANNNDCGCNEYWTGYQGTLCGAHSNYALATEYDEDWDHFRIELKNGWKIIQGEFVKKELTSTYEFLGDPTPDWEVYMTLWKPTFHWKVSPGDMVRYIYKVTIEGPKGVPHY